MSKRKVIGSDTDDSDGSTASSASSKPESEPDYLVEVITKARKTNQGSIEYRVKWANYTSDEDSWEPHENVKECKRLLEEFWKEVNDGKRKIRGPPGAELAASQAWIDKERKYFWDEMNQEKAKEEEKSKRKKEERERKQPPKKGTKLTADADASTSKVKQAEHEQLRKTLFADESSDDEPLIKTITAKNKGKGKEIEKDASKPDAPRPFASTSAAPKLLRLKIPPQSTMSMITKKLPEGLSFKKKTTLSTATGPQATHNQLPVDQPVQRLDQGSSSGTTPAARGRTPTTPVLPAPGTPNWLSTSVNASRPTNSTTTTPGFTSTRTIAQPPITNASGEDVDNFLSTLMPFAASISQKPENMQNSSTETKTTSLPDPQKWRWTGELFLDTIDAAERLCNVSITDATDVSPVGFRMNLLMESKDSIRFSKLYNRFEINSILRSLKKVDQIVKITYHEVRDKDAFLTLLKYMSSQNLAIAMPLITEYGHVAQMLVFPPSSRMLVERLKIPNQYKDLNALILAIMPWNLAPSKYDDRSLRTDEIRETRRDEEIMKIRQWQAQPSIQPSIRDTPRLEVCLRILNFPEDFLRFMPSRRFCVWAVPVEAMPKDNGREFPQTLRRDTIALLTVLDWLKAENVGYKNDLRVVFIHIGAMRTISKLPALVERRFKRPEIRFVTYGHHETVKPALWGYHEIFPLGGVVTFTISALLENPFGVADIIERIDRHPLWACYVLPSVLSVFVRISCTDEDPLTVYRRGPAAFSRILKLIEAGKISLMRSPALEEQALPGNDTDEQSRWLSEQFVNVPKTSVEYVEDCWSTYIARFSNKTEEEIRNITETEIVKDLTLLQVQPGIRENYRRFVVIKAMQDSQIQLDRDGFEWRTVQDFDFRDGFFSKSASETPETPI